MDVRLSAMLSALGCCASFAFGQTQFADLAKGHMPRNGDVSRAVALGDVDGDGDLDIVVGNSPGVNWGGQNRLYLNDGKGGFSDGTTGRLPPDGDFTEALTFGDVDGDGDPDLVLGNIPNAGRLGGRNRLYVNFHRQVVAPLVPQVGFPYPLDLYAAPGYANVDQIIVPFLGLVELSPRIEIRPFGEWGLDPFAMVMLRPVLLKAPAGKASLPFVVPNLALLKGRTLYSQALVLHRPSPSSWRFSNLTADLLR